MLNQWKCKNLKLLFITPDKFTVNWTHFMEVAMDEKL